MTTREQAQAMKNCEAYEALDQAGGIIAFGQWQTGSGNFKKSRAVPPKAAVFASYDTKAPEHVRAWFAAHPRAQRCVAIAG